MAYKKTAHRRRASRRRNARTRKVMRGGGGKFTSVAQCNAAINKDINLKRELGSKTNNYGNPCKPLMDDFGGKY